MLKKLLAFAALLALPVLVQAQGVVNFNTQLTTVAAPIRDTDGTLLAGTNFWAQIYAADGTGHTAQDLRAKGTAVNFRAGGNVGYVQISGSTARGTVVVPAVTVTDVFGGPVTLQVRAWSGTFATYEAALAGGGKTGFSNLLNLLATGAPPGTPTDLVGIQGFNLVPEPSTIALGVLGLGSLLLFRRRKA